MNILRPRDLAAQLGCTERTLRNWVAKGKFPRPAKIPGGVAWTDDVVNRFVSKMINKSNPRNMVY